MLFNSLDFAIFLPIVFALYWLLNHRLSLQNLLIIAASYLFYAFWDWRFLSLLLFSTFTDYIIGICIGKEDNPKRRKAWLLGSISVNLGLLFVFKYFNFFIDSFVSAFHFFGADIQGHSLNIILPIGISFYTFQTLSYTIDIYYKKLEPTRDFLSFAAFVSFFPQLVAGPIERATNFLPQFFTKRTFDPVFANEGLRQMLWGFFKKMVIADGCAKYANMIFENAGDYSGSALLLGTIFFAFQIYGDFSGYSDIAIGCAKLFGFHLKRNFAYPYFSRDIAEFWKRWHISLSTWFRDYLYIPLGGSRGSLLKVIRNTFIIFIVSGLWHGANWTFLIWGTLNAIYFLPLLLSKKTKRYTDIVAKGKCLPSFKECCSMLITFALTLFAWIFFRAESVSDAMRYISGIFSKSLFSLPNYPELFASAIVLLTVVVFVIIEWFGREEEYAIAGIGKIKSSIMRWILYYIIAMAIFLFAGKSADFIYFQF